VEGGERVGNTIALWLQYCGAGFSGWEAKSGARTVQGELEAAASELYGTAIGIVGASRTDAGVHACGQVAHMHVPRSCQVQIPAARVALSLNKRLAADVSVQAAVAVPATWDARRGVAWRR